MGRREMRTVRGFGYFLSITTCIYLVGERFFHFEHSEHGQSAIWKGYWCRSISQKMGWGNQ